MKNRCLKWIQFLMVTSALVCGSQQAYSQFTRGVNADVYALAADTNGNVYAGGYFTTAGNISAQSVAFWNASSRSWSPMDCAPAGVNGDGVAGTVRAIAIASDGKVYVGGQFSGYEPNTDEFNIDVWDPATNNWLGMDWGVYLPNGDVGGDGYMGAVNGIAIAGNMVYVVGDFTSAGHFYDDAFAVTNIAVWNSASNTWSAVTNFTSAIGAPLNTIVTADGVNFYVGGHDGVAHGVLSGGVATWQVMDTNFVGNVHAIALTPNGRLFIGGEGFGGDLAQQGNNFSDSLAEWNGTNAFVRVAGWPGGGGWCPYVNAFSILNNELIVGGLFEVPYPPDTPTHWALDVAKFNLTDNTWSSLCPGLVIGGAGGQVYALAVAPAVSVITRPPTNMVGIITTVAGNGSVTYSGDGGAATNASLNYPYGVVVDAFGDLFIGDFFNNRVRKVGANGIITTVAGNGAPAYSGDNGPATNASLYYPEDMALDASGNLFITDTFNNRVRKVNTNGIITTVAGNGGSAGYSGDGGPATNAKLGNPCDLAFDASGNLFFSDYYNSRIRKVDTNGIITTVAGNGTYGYSGDGGQATNASLAWPRGVTFDTSGNLLIADYRNNRVRKVNTTGIITTVAGGGTSYPGDGGPATNASLYYPQGLALDAADNLFITDGSHNRVRKVDANGIITTVAGNGIAGYSGDGGQATNASLYNPTDVAFDTSGNLIIVDCNNNRVRKVNFNSNITTNTHGPYVYLGGEFYTVGTNECVDNIAAWNPSNNVWSILGSNAPPTVSITTPADGTKNIAPVNITINATAADDCCVAEVDFYQGNTLLGTAGTPPYSFTWNNVPAGRYSLTAVAADNDGATNMSSVVTVTVLSPKPPPIQISVPGDGSIHLTFTWIPGYTNQVEYTDDLSNPNWQTVSVTPDTNGICQFVDWSLTYVPTRFYRAVWK